MIAKALRYLEGPGLGALLVRSVMGSAGLRIAGMGFGFLVGVQLARGLGTEGYGIYGLAMSILALLTVPTEFGLPQLVTREVAVAQVRQEWMRAKGLIRWSRRVILATSAALALVVAGWLIVVSQELNSPLGLTLLAGLVMVPLVALGNLHSAALRGLQHLVKGQIPDTLLRPGSHSLLLFLVPTVAVYPLTPAFAMGLGAVSAGIAFMVALLMLRRHLSAGRTEKMTPVDTRAAWRSALPMALTEGMRMLQGHLVIFILGLLSTAAVIGVYRVASSVAILLATPLTLFNLIGMPIISRLYTKGDTVELQRLLVWLAWGMFLPCTTLAVPFWLAGDQLLSFVFGADFAKSGDALNILAVGVLLNGVCGANAALLNMTNHAERVTRASAVSLVFLAVVSVILIPAYGDIGAALAWTASMSVWNVLMWRDALNLLDLDTSVLAIWRLKSC